MAKVVDIGAKNTLKEVSCSIHARIKLKIYLTKDKTTPGFYKLAEQELVNINRLIEDYMKGNMYEVSAFHWSVDQEESNG
tara:strand:- start:3492 stop:3731 length:240 start_codon:yes stop_codon:yes gene_type:complete